MISTDKNSFSSTYQSCWARLVRKCHERSADWSMETYESTYETESVGKSNQVDKVCWTQRPIIVLSWSNLTFWLLWLLNLSKYPINLISYVEHSSLSCQFKLPFWFRKLVTNFTKKSIHYCTVVHLTNRVGTKSIWASL